MMSRRASGRVQTESERRATWRTKRSPVLIVGGSLVGLTSAMLLGHHGVPSLSVERHAGTAIHPRAGHFQLGTTGDAAPGRAGGRGPRRVAADLSPEAAASSPSSRSPGASSPPTSRSSTRASRAAARRFGCSSTRTCSSRSSARGRSSSARRCATAPRPSGLEQDDDGVTVTLRDLDSGETSDRPRALRHRRRRQPQPDARAARDRDGGLRRAFAQHHDLLPRRLRAAAEGSQPGRHLRPQPRSCAASSGSTAPGEPGSSSSTRVGEDVTRPEAVNVSEGLTDERAHELLQAAIGTTDVAGRGARCRALAGRVQRRDAR